jgi:predicted ATPase/class 3 adenylate cyclase
LEVLAGHEAIEVGGAHRRALLAYLLINAGIPRSVERIIADLWTDGDAAGSRATVQTYISQFRKLFGAHEGAPLITHRSAGYVLELPADALDASRFEALISAGSAETDPEERRRCCEDGIALWRGSPLDEFGGSAWADDPARQWTRMYVLAQQLRIGALLDAGRHHDTLATLEQLVTAHPLHEPFWAELVIARYRSGQQAEALAAGREARRVLAAELGIEPGAELIELERQVLSQDPALHNPTAKLVTGDAWSARTEELPRGVVTVFMTDVESSSRLWDEHPAQMAQALARQEAVIGQVVRAYNGHLLKARGEGDSTLSVFANASEAVAAAVGLQRRLVAEPWPDGVVLQTRIAIHTGEAELRDGDYFGATLNRAARIRSLASGGQILMSRTTRDVVVDALPPDFALTELGTHVMQGMRRDETVFGVEAPGVRTSMTLAERPTAARQTLVGRADALQRVLDLLTEPGLVTVTGAGGIGKTRLMHEICDQRQRRYDRTWVIELAGADGPVAVESALARAVVPDTASMTATAEPAPTDLTTAIASAIGARRCLIAIDNCEHVIDAVARLLAPILRNSPGLSVLATSRQPLQVSGERIVPLDPLAVPREIDDADPARLTSVESIQVILQRTRDAGCELQLSAVTARPLATLCRQLDGIPLALELAAARLRVTAPSDLLARLSRQLDVLRVSGGEPRHRTMYGAIDWSYQLLDEQEQALLRRLGIFVGGFTLDAAEDVCVGEVLSSAEAVYATLAELVSKSLVVFDRDRSRYRLLEPVRFFARDNLEQQGELSKLAHRHGQWALRQARTIAAPQLQGAPGIADAFRVELDNVFAALAWLRGEPDHVTYMRIVATMGYTWFQSDYRRGREAADLAVDMVADASPRLRAAVLLARGMVEQRVDYHESARWLEPAHAMFREIGDRLSLAWSTFFLSRSYFFRDEKRQESLITEALMLFRECRQPLGESSCLLNLGIQATLRGDLDRAEEYFANALDIAAAMGDHILQGMILGELGHTALARGDLDRARAFLREAAAAQHGIDGAHVGSPGQFTAAAWVEVLAEDFEAARRLIFEALRVGLDIDDEWELRKALLVRAVICLKTGDPRHARRLLATTRWDNESPGEYIRTLPQSIVAKSLAELTPILSDYADDAREGRRLGLREAVNSCLAVS